MSCIVNLELCNIRAMWSTGLCDATNTWYALHVNLFPVVFQIWMNVVSTMATAPTSVQTLEGRTGVPAHLASVYRKIAWLVKVKEWKGEYR